MTSRPFGLLVLYALCAATAHALDSAPADMIKARNDYDRSLTEKRLADSKILLDQATAAGLAATAAKDYATAEYYRQRATYLRDYHAIMLQEYARVVSEESNLKTRIYEVRLHQNMCEGLVDGSTRRGGFQCLQYFRRYVVAFSLQKKLLFDDKVEPLPADDFEPNDPDRKALPFKGGNLGQLLVFAENNGLSFTPFGRSHSFVMGFLDAIQVTAQTKIQEYRNWIDGIRAGTLNVFNLPPA